MFSSMFGQAAAGAGEVLILWGDGAGEGWGLPNGCAGEAWGPRLLLLLTRMCASPLVQDGSKAQREGVQDST
eukprot:354988-Chlamydomonas_euryale.AAC.9